MHFNIPEDVNFKKLLLVLTFIILIQTIISSIQIKYCVYRESKSSLIVPYSHTQAFFVCLEKEQKYTLF